MLRNVARRFVSLLVKDHAKIKIKIVLQLCLVARDIKNCSVIDVRIGIVRVYVRFFCNSSMIKKKKKGKKKGNKVTI